MLSLIAWKKNIVVVRYPNISRGVVKGVNIYTNYIKRCAQMFDCICLNYLEYFIDLNESFVNGFVITHNLLSNMDYLFFEIRPLRWERGNEF